MPSGSDTKYGLNPFQFMRYMPVIQRLLPEAKEVLRLSHPAIKYMVENWSDIQPHLKTIMDDEELRGILKELGAEATKDD